MKPIASIFGIGYIKGGGTVAAIAAALLWYFMHPVFGAQLLLLSVITVLGVYAGNKVEAEWGKDSSKVVIDEVAGMFLSLLLIPVHWITVLAALVLFRFFDIVKPLGVRRMEVFKGGWGVMADDLLAGLYANIVLQLLLQLHLFPEII
ncbi:MAG: phosphatidylglycerophosphatase A [Chitinophagaceae bacterium]